MSHYEANAMYVITLYMIFFINILITNYYIEGFHCNYKSFL